MTGNNDAELRVAFLNFSYCSRPVLHFGIGKVSFGSAGCFDKAAAKQGIISREPAYDIVCGMSFAKIPCISLFISNW